jgi:hypothetical protein
MLTWLTGVIRRLYNGARVLALAAACCSGFFLQAVPASGATFSLKAGETSFDLELDLPPDIVARSGVAAIHFKFKAERDLVDDPDINALPGFSIETTTKSSTCGEYLGHARQQLYRFNPGVEWTTLSEWADILECALTVRSGDRQKTVYYSARFIWNPACRCFLKIGARYRTETINIIRYLENVVVQPLRKASAKPFEDPNTAMRLILTRDPTIPKDAGNLGEIQRQISEAEARSAKVAAGHQQLLVEILAAVIQKTKARQEEKARQEQAAREEEKANEDIKRALEKMEAMNRRFDAEEKRIEEMKAANKRAAIDPNAFPIEVKNSTNRTVHLRFFNFGFSNSGSAKGVWPAAGKVYVIQAEKTGKYNLACRKGERICFGAEFATARSANSAYFYWGAALSGKKGCTKCCAKCGNGRFGTSLTHDGRSLPPPQVSSNNNNHSADDSNDGLELLGGLLGAVGGVIANQPVRRVQQPTYRPRSMPAAPRGPNYRPSGISR